MREKTDSCFGVSNHGRALVFRVTALLLLVLSGFLHFFRIGEVPNGFYADEASIGYNAFCIAETGADEYGIKYPVFFRCFDNYHEPVMVYTIAPMVRIFGLEKWVVRFPSGIFHILASIALFFLAMKYVRNKWICLAGAFLFSILPWVFPISRVMMSGYTAMLLGMAAGWYFLMNAVGGRSFSSAALAGGCWAFAMYAHNIGRPMTAVILVCFVLALNVLLIRRWKVFAVFFFSYVMFLSPMIVSVINHPDSMIRRFSTLSVWSGSSGAWETLARISDRYLEYFSPAFLFISGDPNLRHHTGASGELYMFMLPFIISGIYCFYKGFTRNAYIRFAVLALAAYPFAAILTVDHMHSTRSINGAIPWSIVSVVGAGYMWNRGKELIFRIVFIFLLIYSVYEAGSYFTNYFGRYVERSRLDYMSPLVEAFEYSFKNLGAGEALHVSPSVIPQRIDSQFKPHWYVYPLFFGKISPAAYQGNGIPGDYVRVYGGKDSGHGILLRANIVRFMDKGGKHFARQNNEALPVNCVLIHKIPIMVGAEDCIEVYRF